MDPYRWSWNPEALFLVPVMSTVYVLAIRRFPANAWRIASFATAMVLLLAVTITPLETIAMNYLLVIHLLQNVVLAEWAPLLVVLALPPALASRLAQPSIVRTLTHPASPSRSGSRTTCSGTCRGSTTRRSKTRTLLHLEHALYFATGVLMWWGVVQDEPHRLGPGIRAGVVFAAFILGSPIGLVLALVPEAVYDFYVDAPERLWGLSALEDQQLAGILMAFEQAVVFFAVFAFFFLRFLVDEERKESRACPGDG